MNLERAHRSTPRTVRRTWGALFAGLLAAAFAAACTKNDIPAAPTDTERLTESAVALDPNDPVRITQVHNDEHRSQRFSVSTSTRVRVYALGEGVGGRMADYGWIEKANSGDVVWEMTYTNTGKAGGHDKNRVFDGEILLEPGTYVVHYVTDYSHSFGSWNARPPLDLRSWGITVSVARK